METPDCPKIAAIVVSADFVAFHQWPDAPEPVAFLRYKHRHVFRVQLSIQVEGLNRSLEFFTVQNQLKLYVRDRFEGQTFSYSCEQIADKIFDHMRLTHGYRVTTVLVSEDGENAGVINRAPAPKQATPPKNLVVIDDPEADKKGEPVIARIKEDGRCDCDYADAIGGGKCPLGKPGFNPNGPTDRCTEKELHAAGYACVRIDKDEKPFARSTTDEILGMRDKLKDINTPAIPKDGLNPSTGELTVDGKVYQYESKLVTHNQTYRSSATSPNTTNLPKDQPVEPVSLTHPYLTTKKTKCFVGVEAEGALRGELTLFVPASTDPKKFRKICRKLDATAFGVPNYVYIGAGNDRFCFKYRQLLDEAIRLTVQAGMFAGITIEVGSMDDAGANLTKYNKGWIRFVTMSPKDLDEGYGGIGNDIAVKVVQGPGGEPKTIVVIEKDGKKTETDAYDPRFKEDVDIDKKFWPAAQKVNYEDGDLVAFHELRAVLFGNTMDVAQIVDDDCDF
jgi:hypothetical protein